MWSRVLVKRGPRTCTMNACILGDFSSRLLQWATGSSGLGFLTAWPPQLVSFRTLGFPDLEYMPIVARATG